MTKKIILAAAGLVFIAGGLYAIKRMQFAAMSAAVFDPPPEIVTAATVREENWESTVNAIGSLTAVQGVTVASEIPGKVARIAFESGSLVQAGDLLVQLDVSTEEAQLRAAEATAVLARLNLDRAKELLAKTTISQAELDAAEAQHKQASAQADSIRAVIARKAIRAPFAGRLGIRLVNLGQILKEGEAITTLQTLDPIYVNFSLPQQHLGLLTPGTTVRVTSDAAPGEIFEGRINAVNPEVDAATRNIRAQATLANAEARLHPGMFASVAVVPSAKEAVLTIPSTAVLYAPYGNSVFVIEEKKNQPDSRMNQVLRQQFVRLGAMRGDFVSIVSGLKAGETVVTTGAFKLHPGMVVVIDNQLAPNAQLAPKPGDT